MSETEWFGASPEPESQDTPDRRYICLGCESVVRARWNGPGDFAVGCDCTTVPVVPQMGQAETPDNWRVEREDCCRDVEPKELDTYYGNDADYQCPDCNAKYEWDGTMVGAPECDER